MKKLLFVLLIACGDNDHVYPGFGYSPVDGGCHHLGKDLGQEDECIPDNGNDNGSTSTDNPSGSGSGSMGSGEDSNHPLTPACIVGLVMSGQVPHECHTPPGQLP